MFQTNFKKHVYTRIYKKQEKKSHMHILLLKITPATYDIVPENNKKNQSTLLICDLYFFISLGWRRN